MVAASYQLNGWNQVSGWNANSASKLTLVFVNWGFGCVPLNNIIHSAKHFSLITLSDNTAINYSHLFYATFAEPVVFCAFL